MTYNQCSTTMILALVASNLPGVVARSLEENNSQSRDSQDDGQYYYEDDGDGFNILDRLKEDAQSMWTSPPNEWIEEYWEVFGVAALVALLVFACHCLMCCLPSDQGQERKVATSADLNDYQRRSLEQPILVQQSDRPLSPSSPGLLSDLPTSPEGSSLGSPKTVSPPGALAKAETPASPKSSGRSMQSSSVSEVPQPPPPGRRRVRPTNVVKEVFSVWGEFLGLSEPDDVSQYYRTMEDRKATSKKTKRKIRNRHIVAGDAGDLPSPGQIV